MPEETAFQLSAAQARVLGALVEKEVTTPEYYPLTLNALVNASNQRSNREPVMTLAEDEVREALAGLEELGLAAEARADGRVAKFEHRFGEIFNFTRAETALLCVLLLRGPQTPGELRGRTERLQRFDDITDVVAGLKRLMERAPALVALLPRAPGAREARYAHLLSGPVDAALLAVPSAAMAATPGVDEERIARLESEVADLRQQVAALSEKLSSLLG
jgi:uncharacterized protein